MECITDYIKDYLTGDGDKYRVDVVTGISFDGVPFLSDKKMHSAAKGDETSTEIDTTSADMGLVIQDSKLLIKDGKLATATQPSEACDCCDSRFPVNAAHTYSNSGPQVANTAAEAIQLASQSASANSAAIPNSIWTVGTPEGVLGLRARLGMTRHEINTNALRTGLWVNREWESSEADTAQPFSYFTPNATCEGPDDGLYDCPEFLPQPPPVPVFVYREDGEGTCTQYELNGDYFDGFSSEAEAQAAGDAACQYPDAPECYDCRADVAFEGDDNWSYTLTFREFTYDDEGNITGCEQLVTPNVTKANCTGDPLADFQWENDLPPTHCRPVSSEDECTEDTGVFCPNVTDGNQIDVNDGCPQDPQRSNPLP